VQIKKRKKKVKGQGPIRGIKKYQEKKVREQELMAMTTPSTEKGGDAQGGEPDGRVVPGRGHNHMKKNITNAKRCSKKKNGGMERGASL